MEPATEVLSGAVATSDAQRLGRVVLEGYDRFADRVLERLRMLREDVDTDLGAVRSELATLRQAVDDVAERVELRKLRATIDELRGDISGLRRAVLEWPELEQVSSDVAALRADLSDMAKPVSRDLTTLAPMLEEIAALREEFVSLRRRIALRVSNEGELSEERIAAIADAVAKRLQPPRVPRGR